MSQVTTPTNSYVTLYPEAIDFAEKQTKVMWFPDEFDVSKDVHDLRSKMTPAELHGVTTVLKLFTKYELIVGNEYWSGKIAKSFPRPEIERMAATFAFVELGVHAPFYAKVNQVLMLDTDEFYAAYLEDSDLVGRMDFIDEVLNCDNLALSVAAFSLLEGVVLYSSFAFLKSFQAQGRNLIGNVCAGLSMSEVDERIHSAAGAWLYNTLVKEDALDRNELDKQIAQVVETLVNHEFSIVNKIFEKGPIEGLTPTDMNTFVMSRANKVMSDLGMAEQYLYEINDNPIADWFYDQVRGYRFNDFFVTSGTAYTRAVEEEAFEW